MIYETLEFNLVKGINTFVADPFVVLHVCHTVLPLCTLSRDSAVNSRQTCCGCYFS